MYRLLIVDDEHHIVDWLYELFQENNEMELDIFKAYTAKSALRILERQRIDVVLSDIRMPGMDGFELADVILKNWPGSQVIFLTGYDEFDYVYRANQMGDIRYLLKTEEDDVILQAVRSAVERVEEKLREKSTLQQAIGQQQAVSQLLLNQEICRYLHSLAANPGAKYPFPSELESLFQGPITLLLGDVRNPPDEEDLAKTGECLIQLQKLSGQFLSARNMCRALHWEGSYFLWLIQPLEGTESSYLSIREALETFAFVCRESMGLDIFFILLQEMVSGSQIESAVQGMIIAAQERRDAGASVYVLNEQEERSSTEYHYAHFPEHELKKRATQLSTDMEQGNEDAFWKNFQALEKSFQPIASLQFLPAIELYKNIALGFLNYVNRHFDAGMMRDIKSAAHWGELTAFSSWTEAIEYLRNIASRIFAVQKRLEEDSESNLISSIKHYIQNNINGELSLLRISESVNYNPSYVSRKFRQATGMTLFDYITRVRISRAKELLRSTDEPVQKIAARVGFDSSQYFSTVFKKYVGISPNEFRGR